MLAPKQFPRLLVRRLSGHYCNIMTPSAFARMIISNQHHIPTASSAGVPSRCAAVNNCISCYLRDNRRVADLTLLWPAYFAGSQNPKVKWQPCFAYHFAWWKILYSQYYHGISDLHSIYLTCKIFWPQLWSLDLRDDICCQDLNKVVSILRTTRQKRGGKYRKQNNSRGSRTIHYAPAHHLSIWDDSRRSGSENTPRSSIESGYRVVYLLSSESMTLAWKYLRTIWWSTCSAKRKNAVKKINLANPVTKAERLKAPKSDS